MNIVNGKIGIIRWASSNICLCHNLFLFIKRSSSEGWRIFEGFQALEQRDYKTALYYGSFAANGDTQANYNLGLMYREGLGVEKDDVQSLTHLIAAAENGHMLGNYAVGLAFNWKRKWCWCRGGYPLFIWGRVTWPRNFSSWNRRFIFSREVSGQKFCLHIFGGHWHEQKRSRCLKKLGVLLSKMNQEQKDKHLYYRRNVKGSHYGSA